MWLQKVGALCRTDTKCKLSQLTLSARRKSGKQNEQRDNNNNNNLSHYPNQIQMHATKSFLVRDGNYFIIRIAAAGANNADSVRASDACSDRNFCAALLLWLLLFSIHIFL